MSATICRNNKIVSTLARLRAGDSEKASDRGTSHQPKRRLRIRGDVGFAVLAANGFASSSVGQDPSWQNRLFAEDHARTGPGLHED